MTHPAYYYAGAGAVFLLSGSLLPLPAVRDAHAQALRVISYTPDTEYIQPQLPSFDMTGVPPSRPAVPESVAASAPPPPIPADIFADVTLQAIVVTDEAAMALVKDSQEVRTLRFGSIYREYVVSTVTDRAVTLTSGEESITLELPEATVTP